MTTEHEPRKDAFWIEPPLKNSSKRERGDPSRPAAGFWGSVELLGTEKEAVQKDKKLKATSKRSGLVEVKKHWEIVMNKGTKRHSLQRWERSKKARNIGS